MVRAKFSINKIELYQSPKNTGRITMSPVYKSQPGVSGNACEENRLFWEASPSGEITMSIMNPAGFEPFLKAFQAGKPFYVDFTEAPE